MKKNYVTRHGVELWLPTPMGKEWMSTIMEKNTRSSVQHPETKVSQFQLGKNQRSLKSTTVIDH